jgi:hypothetical protein
MLNTCVEHISHYNIKRGPKVTLYGLFLVLNEHQVAFAPLCVYRYMRITKIRGCERGAPDSVCNAVSKFS